MELLVGIGAVSLALLVLAVIVESERKKLDRGIKNLSSYVLTINDNLYSHLLKTDEQLMETQSQLRTAIRQLNSVSEALLEKEDKRTLTIDEALARIPKKSALKEKKPSRKTPTLARKLTKAK
jgi:ribosomal protein S20